MFRINIVNMIIREPAQCHLYLCEGWAESFYVQAETNHSRKTVELLLCVCLCVYICVFVSVSVSVYMYSTHSVYSMLPSLNRFIINSSCKDSVIFNIPRIVCIHRNGCYTHHIPTIWITLNQIHQMLIWFRVLL